MKRPKNGLGASDAAAILGISRWHTALDVYNQKVGLVEPSVDAEYQSWGRLLEPPLAKRYTQETGRRLERVNVLRHPIHRWLYAHPDRVVVGEPGLVEIKVSSHSWKGEIPIYYKTQAIHQMIVAGAEWVDFAVLERGQKFATPPPRLDRPDEQTLADFVAELSEFWFGHVLPRVPPEMDGTDAGRQYLRSMYPQSTALEVLATAEMEKVVDEYRMTRSNREQAERQEEALKQKVQQMMGDAQHLGGGFGRVSWTRFAYDKTDWKRLAEDYERMIVELARVGSKTMQMTGKEAIEWLRPMHTNRVKSERFTVDWKEDKVD